MKQNIKKNVIDYIISFIGAALFAISFNLFIKNSDTQIAMGGITGISMIFNYFFPNLSMGLLTLLVNIPFLILGTVKIGGRFMAKTIFASISLSVVMYLTEWLPPLSTDPLLCSIYGGLGTGLGIGLVFLRGGSTAGSDIVGIVAKQRFTGISIGRLVLITDAIIVLLSAFAFQNINSILYAIIKMYAASIATDGILYGFTTDKLAYIISDRAPELGKLVIERIGHGATILTGEGAYTNQPRKMLMCAINPNQIGALKDLVREADNDAFMIVMSTHEVLGFGFKPNIKSNV